MILTSLSTRIAISWRQLFWSPRFLFRSSMSPFTCGCTLPKATVARQKVSKLTGYRTNKNLSKSKKYSLAPAIWYFHLVKVLWFRIFDILCVWSFWLNAGDITTSFSWDSWNTGHLSWSKAGNEQISSGESTGPRVVKSFDEVTLPCWPLCCLYFDVYSSPINIVKSQSPYTLPSGISQTYYKNPDRRARPDYDRYLP